MNTEIDIPCWSVLAGTIGSYASIDFGKKIKRNTSLNNPAISEEQRMYVGEWSLFTQCSYWVLIRDSWVEVHADSAKSVIKEKLGFLVGDHVINKSCGDDKVLTLSFRSGAMLTVYPVSKDGGYCLFSGQQVIENSAMFMV